MSSAKRTAGVPSEDDPRQSSGSAAVSVTSNPNNMGPRKALARRLGSSVARQFAGALPSGGQAASLIGQLARSPRTNGAPQEGASSGGDQPDEPAALSGGNGAAVEQLLGTIACSAVQGIRRAAAAQSIPVRAFWTLMVCVSIGLFIRGATTQSLKLANVRVEKAYQLDKVPFVFPDLYFCPSNSYSGSFPYTLDEAQAESVNKEVKRLGLLFDQQQPTSGHDASSKTRVWLIQQSMPVHLLAEYIMHRQNQSLFYTPEITNSGDADIQVVILPGSKICFRILITEEDREKLTERQNGEDLRLALFTDPYFANFKYSGHPIDPIVNPLTNDSVPFRTWYPAGIINLMASGYTMLIVPRGAYPSFEHETRIKLAPGKSYDIDIHMEENRFSDELWGSHCSPNHENAAFVDHLTGQRVEYNYSYDACYFTEFAKTLHKVGGYVQQGFPVTWDLRDSPRWGNLSENPRINRSTADYGNDLSEAYDLSDPTMLCRRQQPCVLNKYSASFSFHNWPSMGGLYSTAFQDSNPRERPAISQLAKIARQLDAGNYSSQSEAEFRQIVTESLLEVRVRAVSPQAARVLLTSMYTGTSFLSDIGGLMGLYLGCSVLTIFELLEMLYLKADQAVRARRDGGSQRQSEPDDDEAEDQSAEMDRLDDRDDEGSDDCDDENMA